jgi:hypothetical protein
MSIVSNVVLATAAALLTGRAVAQNSLQCTFFSKPNLIMVGGHEDNTAVIPVVLDYTTLDLTLDQACHGLTWGIATEKGTDEKRSRETICFNIGAQADDEGREIEAAFLNIPDNGALAGVTKSVATISAREDRATAIKLAEQCRMRGQRPKEGTDGLDVDI